MSNQVLLILACTHVTCIGIGCWIGEQSLRKYKDWLFRGKLYTGSHFQNPLRRRSWK